MRFNFTGVGAPGTSALSGAVSGGVSPWCRISERTHASSYLLTGIFVASIQPEYSNNPEFDKGSDFAPDPQIDSVPALRELPIGIADFVRWRCTAYTSGTPVLSTAKALSANGSPVVLSEDTSKTPAPSSQGRT